MATVESTGMAIASRRGRTFLRRVSTVGGAPCIFSTCRVDRIAAVYFLVALIATLYAAAVFADRLDRLGARLGLPEALLGLLAAAGADAPELAAAITALATGAKGVGLGVVVGSNVFNLGAMLGVWRSPPAP